MTILSVSQSSGLDRRAVLAINQLIGKKLNIQAVTADYTVDNDYDVFTVDTTAGNVTISLPAAVLHSGRVINIKRMDGSANTLTVDGNSSETIDGAATLLIPTQYQNVALLCDGTGWLTL